MLESSIGYVDAEYSDLDEAETLITKDNDLERVPETTLSASISKDFSIGDYGNFRGRVDWSWRDEQYMDTFNTEQIAQDDYQLVNANLSWWSASNRFSATAGVKNINDEDYLITGVLGDAFQSYEGVYDRGREYYLTLRYNFGDQ
jgi:iron complex outermembrane receptor protein